MLPGPYDLIFKPFHLTQSQVVLGFSDNPDGLLWLLRITSLSEDVNLFNLSIPTLPCSLQNANFPTQLSL